MISFFEASLCSISVHRIGNKTNDEGCSFSENPIQVTEEQASFLMNYFLSPFQKENAVFNFYHPSDHLDLNPAFSITKQMFNPAVDFHEQSKDLGRLLYDATRHPKIKQGELYVVYFKDIQLEGELHEAIGLFKSEQRETYLKAGALTKGFLEFDNDAVDLSNLSDGCLILNKAESEGFKVFTLSEKTKGISYWKDEFLFLKIENNDFHKTNTFFSVFKHFVDVKLTEDFEISKVDRIDLLNKSVQYFKKNESFDQDEFTNEVIANPEAIQSFMDCKKSHEIDFEVAIPDSFNISTAGVKKQSTQQKSILKLDKNFQIKLIGNKDLIEKGFDEDKSMNFYKIYFKEEN